MRQIETAGLTVEQVQEMARRELSMTTRIGYLLLLMITLMGAGLISILWLTEPGPLPLRTQVAFGLLVAINLSWSMLFGWVLTRRKVLFAIHKVIAGWMAVVFCSVFLLFGLAIGILRMNPTMMIIVGVVGAVQLLVAIMMLNRGQRRRRELLARRHVLIGALAECRRA
jgi:membrane associated rhomboid family serine protease